MKELISVIIPAYNHERYVQETIWSIINQTYKNLELIIINDGSIDKTHEKILELEEKCKNRFVRFIYNTKKNSGVSEALNDGIDIAQGEYVYSIASDDLAKPNAIEILYNFIKDKPEYALVVGDDDFIDCHSNNVVVNWQRHIIYNENENKEQKTYKTASEWAYENNNRFGIDFNSEDFGTYFTLLYNCYLPNGYLINRQAIIDSGKYRKDCAEDWYIFLQLSKKYKFKYIDKLLFSYRCHPTNSQKNKKYIQKIIYNIFKYEKDYAYKHGCKEIYNARTGHLKLNKMPKSLEKIFRVFLKIIFKDYYDFKEKSSSELRKYFKNIAKETYD